MPTPRTTVSCRPILARGFRHVKVERQRLAVLRDGQHAVGWMLELAGVVVELVRRPRAGDAASARFRARGLARLFVLKANRVLTFGPWREREAEEPLIDVVRHNVVEW